MVMMLDPNDKELAFVVIDLQNRYRTEHDDMESEFHTPIKLTNRIAAKFRGAGRPVIFVRMIGGENCHPYEGDDGDDFISGVEVLPGDLHVSKRHMNSFRDTDLVEVVRGCGCDAVLLAGTVTQYCVLSTYFAAFDHDLTSYIAEGACISAGEGRNEAVYSIVKTMTPPEVEAYLESHRRVRADP